ncbi:alpha-L-fucosidase [Mediterraneibacter faecis]|uniref:alpha-L-fucosidase n=3 Tax=Mediterraneibacter faecis TaxID=592978 RepID=UPI001D084874|nr:alpha-L-fucosidase [Mediterraneibacter faecis]MCB5892101.1 alpha-L-fucosidase [Lachnospiraceae bacterium 210521-DFI.4.71]MCB7115629.1 alpha-L-fucosidase [Mediterraneibacter faecis]MCB7118854.1 alpha-L-fucosidase [Mediterraneibacter faecis]MCB7291194.1 alpha-L-fucosidase [Mediterraneibacter faecis]MCB7426499.1 alpha-L-fucosidase [Mediterraneibacter faecis]
MKKKTVSMFMGLVLGVTTVFSSIGPAVVTVSAAAAESGVTDSDCTDKSTKEPESDKVVPDANQYKYQKDELAAFCHFGPNTFNEIEWGEHYGDKKPSEIFTLKDNFDADTLVRTLKNAGFKKLIITAKHHDGFCIWPSKYTEYDAEAAGYKGDILAEISAACTTYNMDMGLYLSPWDIHEPSYGYYDANGKPTSKENDVLDYNEYYNNQLEEILGNSKYGNNGHFVEVWMDGAKGSGANAQDYEFTKWFDTIQKHQGKKAGKDADCMLFGAQAYTTVRWIGNEDGVAHENTWAKSKVNEANNTIDSNGTTPYTIGYADGNKWTVPECDGRITSGWFWGTKKNTPKTITQLANMYFDSVGHNATMLLNVPPNNQGTVDKPILDRVTEFGRNVEETFRKNLAKNATIEASNVRGNDIAFKPGNVVDDKDETYWTTEDGTKEGSLTIKWDKAKKFDVVSIEEAIQKGQHINSYKVEYKASDDAQWQTLKSGVTVGAKRLVRTAPVSATQVKITVGTTNGKVPMLSEVGVYKASEGFQLAGAAPEGMDTTSVNETSKFTFSPTGWNPQTGSQYINGQNTWSNKANAEFTFKFHGTKAYLMGTTDPGHGQADVYIDDKLVETINTHAESRSTGAKIFESEDLTDADHTLRLVAKTDAAIGVEAAYVINNGGVGMIELEKDAYTMNEKEELTVKVKRVGGSNGKLTAKIQPNPGSAIQNDFNTEYAPDVIFEAGETEKSVVAAKTKQNTAITGDRVFSIELTEKTPKNAIIGFNGSARITIKDADGITKDKLQTLVTNSAALEEHLYSEGWDAFAKALKTAQEVVENESATDATIRSAYTELDKAKAALKVREKYTENDRFNFPWRAETSAKLEAEFATVLKDDPTSDAQYPMKIDAKSDASNGKFVTDMAANDVLKYAYHADKAGTYQVVMRYRSGSAENAKNSIKITEAKGKIKDQEVIVDPKKENDNVVFGTVTFDIEVVKPGDGMIVITPPEKRDGLDGKGPGIDYFIISPKNVVLDKFAITATAGKGGTITTEDLTDGKITEGESATFTITPNSGYEIADVKVDGNSVGKKTSYTFSDVDKAHKIEATFAFANYTAENPFVFPETKGVTSTLEAEHATELINSNDSDSDPNWPLTITSEGWASNGKFLNCMAYKDYAKYAYTANVPGIYKVTGTYRAGALNKLAFSEEGSKIKAAQVECPSTKEGNNLTVKTFELNIEVKTAGAGTLVLTAPDTNKAPQLDKLEIELIRTAGEADLTELTATIAEAEKVLNAEDKDKYAATALVELQKMVNDGKAFTENTSQADVDAKKAEIKAKIADIQTQFTITATAGEGGKIAPEATTTVYKGTSKVFTITPDKGYHIESITVDGENVETIATEYAFEDIVANHTIEVTFAKDELTIAKENLLATINTANKKLAETEQYTPSSLKDLEDAVKAAQAIYDDPNADQNKVNEAKTNVEDKMKALKAKAKKDALNLAITAAEGDAALVDKYTEESIEKLQKAIKEAKEVLADENASQEEVDAAEKAVKAAQKALVEKETPKPEAPVKKDELKAAVEDATKVVGDTEQYTEESLAALQAAIDKAIAVLDNPESTQAEIDAAVKSVKEAKEALKVKEDKKDDNNKGDDKKDDSNKGDDNKKDDSNSGTSNNGSSNGGTSNKNTTSTVNKTSNAVKTGDAANVAGVAGVAILCLATGIVVVLIKRKRIR